MISHLFIATCTSSSLGEGAVSKKTAKDTVSRHSTLRGTKLVRL